MFVRDVTFHVLVISCFIKIKFQIQLLRYSMKEAKGDNQEQPKVPLVGWQALEVDPQSMV